MADAPLGQQLLERAVAAIDVGIVGEQAPGLDPVRGVEGEAAFDEGGDGRGLLVWVELRVGQSRVVVDERVHELVSDSLALFGPGAIADAGDGVPRSREAGKALAVDVQ